MKGIKLSHLPKIENVAFIKDEMAFVLDDGRIIYVPLSWSKKLQKANATERMNFKINGVHVFLDDIDEIIGVKNSMTLYQTVSILYVIVEINLRHENFYKTFFTRIYYIVYYFLCQNERWYWT